jgi:hypothetical protein
MADDRHEEVARPQVLFRDAPPGPIEYSGVPPIGGKPLITVRGRTIQVPSQAQICRW